MLFHPVPGAGIRLDRSDHIIPSCTWSWDKVRYFRSYCSILYLELGQGLIGRSILFHPVPEAGIGLDRSENIVPSCVHLGRLH